MLAAKGISAFAMWEKEEAAILEEPVSKILSAKERRAAFDRSVLRLAACYDCMTCWYKFDYVAIYKSASHTKPRSEKKPL